ncbi:hypothetical protein AVI51_02960 [Piscirickettsia salmonis]|uniref:Uncharacterized protein n=1 Tax=Piscirickettsia salmonis TaxID=1238 RepID=A0A9Q6PSJ4_PISSA|nr:hypothetical protein [Piscirickettsia salmonis]ALA25027.1 hypothetical protein KW89_1561 [Piscirickettsia salmonis]APS45314.1 hypothetical protein AVI48_13675 [Piscirickettsia salmonis]APS48674.1 hypothetical protein AVI49_14285 [Piscirickettsia salmonis]APS49919.1 hypothetical protein AVI50_03000 [Piscirickettsia salmonis]APS53110.1 hypothetical protein AVI51_02960 [Piscirickettsia salmonis]
MPKFHQSFYIAFLADAPKRQLFGLDSYKNSFFLQKDKDLSREYTINMHTMHRRKSLLKDEIPFVRINFPYKEDLSREWRVSLDKTNKQVADEMVKAVLSKAEPFTRIYLDINRVSIDCFQQVTYHRRGNSSHEVSTKQVAELLAQSIPEYAKNNLQIKLVVSYAEIFAESLMKELDLQGFKKTSVTHLTH